MIRRITIHKPTHKFFAPHGTPAIAVGQLRGSTLYLNRIGPNGEVAEKAVAVESCARHLTGYGKGVASDNERAVRDMRAAWAFQFGDTEPLPAFCEVAQ